MKETDKNKPETTGYTSKHDRVPRGIARYGFGEWDRALGNHRAVIKVNQPGEAAYAYLPWRRHDAFPQAKHVRIVDGQTGNTITNSVVASNNREYGEIVFEPVSGSGIYYAYYLVPTSDRFRWVWPRSSFPVTMYETPHCEADNVWREKHNLRQKDISSTPDPKNWATQRNDCYPAPWRDLLEAELVEFQSRGEWHSFYPMEVIATLDERLELIKRCGNRPFLAFPESRFRPIRMNKDIPYHWAIRKGEELARLEEIAQRNEYLVFQIGVYAHMDILANLKATWSGLKGNGSRSIPASAITCFNLEGVNQHGQPFVKTVHVGAKEIQALWFGIDIPKNAKAGHYEGTVTITAQDCEPQTVTLVVNVENKVMVDRGDGDGTRLSRLRWLNSTYALDDLVCAPYTPVKVTGRSVGILGRKLELDMAGLPAHATSYIEMFRIRKEGREILSGPVRLDAVKGGKPLAWKTAIAAHCVKKSSGKAIFQSTQTASGLKRKIETTVEMDGRIGVRVTLEAKKATRLDAMRLCLKMPAGVSRYWLESAPPSWEVAGANKLAFECPAHTDKPLSAFQFAWIGDYNAGLCLSIDACPGPWRQGGTGGMFRQKTDSGICRIELDTGALTIEAGKALTLEFALYMTPFKPLSVEHWDWRYHHEGADLDIRKGLEAGAKVFTQHQGSPNNPYINYIFPVADTLKKMAETVHKNGGLFKAYNTIREQSTRTNELWALRSLGHEILVECTGNLGYESMAQLPLEYQLRNQVHEPFTGQLWMCEHLVDDYHSRWHSSIRNTGGALITEDSSVQISGASRWSNFYIESQRWLMENAGVDGLYLDGVTFDRPSFMRVRKTLVRQKPEALIDFHGSPAEVWDFFGFGDSLWFGEGADYGREAAYWLVAVSGIPFGIAGELLMAEGSCQRGMVYGISHRLGWTQADPSPLWKWWDNFEIHKAEMLGYWMQACPVKTNHPAVKATAYVHKGKRMAIAVASWAKEPVTIKLELDWKAVGLNPANVHASIPEIATFQQGSTSVSLDAMTIEPNKGFIVVLE